MSDTSRPATSQPASSAEDELAQHAEQKSQGLLSEFVDFLRHNKKWWLAPIIIILLIAAAVVFLGGTAIFLIGMDQMVEAVKIAAGDRLRDILGKLTTNRIMGVLTGAGVTAVIQSSSITTVMLVGFVSAGLMSLAQAIGVIFGASRQNQDVSKANVGEFGGDIAEAAKKAFAGQGQ